MNGRLYRSRDERVLTGVAGGLADYLDVDPSLVRLVWVILAVFSGGAFLIVYIVMALVVPQEPWPDQWTATVPPPGAPMAATTPSAAAAGEPAVTDAAAGGETAATASATPPPPDWNAQPGDWRSQREAWRAQRRRERAARRAAGGDGSGAGLVFGLILVAIGVFFLLPIVLPTFALERYWPLILVGLGVVLVVAALRPGRSGP